MKILSSRLPALLNMVRKQFVTNQFKHIRSYVTKRMLKNPVAKANVDVAAADGSKWPRKIFSGVQPSGELHLGNYLGTMRKWKQLQEAKEEATYCIVDMHSVTVPQEPAKLSENIMKLAATMFACGLDINKSTIFVQSAVKEHTELCWLLGTFCTMARLGHLPQYKEKTQKLRDIPLGLFIYPVLQSADIMLYKSTHVPVGEDQVQHIQLAQHIAKVFNTRYGATFPICHAIIEDNNAGRIRSLRDPSKKMSKSDLDQKSAIFLDDDADVVLEKVKKAITDFSSDVSFDPVKRPGVSNLITIHSNITGQAIEEVIKEAETLDTGRYKLRVAEAINEHLKPIREGIKNYLDNPSELINLLEIGAERARYIAYDTVEEVKHKMGLGAPYLPLYLETVKQAPKFIDPDLNTVVTNNNQKAECTKKNFQNSETEQVTQEGTTLTPTASIAAKHSKARMLSKIFASLEVNRNVSVVRIPEVPQQTLRVEKIMEHRRNPIAGKPFNIVTDITKGLLSKRLLSGANEKAKDDENSRGKSEFNNQPEIRRVARCVSVVNAPPTIVAPPPPPSTPATPKEIELSDINIQSSCEATQIVGNAACIITTSPEVLTTNANASQPDRIKQTNGENSIHHHNHYHTAAPTKLVKASRLHSTKTATETATATTPITTIRRRILVNTTLKRFFRTTSAIMVDDQQSDVQKNAAKSSSKESGSQKITERTLIFAILAISAGFGGVYYFWRSVLKAYFDSKRKGGGGA